MRARADQFVTTKPAVKSQLVMYPLRSKDPGLTSQVSLIDGEGPRHPHAINAWVNHRDEPRLGQRLAQYSNLPSVTSHASWRHQPGTSLLHISPNDHDSLAALTTASSGSRQTGSVSTSYGADLLPARILEYDHQGALQIAPLRGPPVYECLFDKLGCQIHFSAFDKWCDHSLTHFKGVAPPKTNRCCFCDKKFSAPTGWRSWTLCMEHTELHCRLGHTRAIARFDSELYRHLRANNVIDEDTWSELVGRSVNRPHVPQPYPSSLPPSSTTDTRPIMQMNNPRRQDRPRRGR